jgi:hypothetical protein
MKRTALFILFFTCSLSLFSQTTSVTAPGAIGVSCSEYVNNMTRIWNITISGNLHLQLNYTVKTEANYDKLFIYSINDAGTSTLQATLSGTQTGKITSLYPNGKMQVVFTTDGSVNCSTHPAYTGFTIHISKITGISFAYDAAGNRTKREIILEIGLRASNSEEDEEEEIIFSETIDYLAGEEQPAAEIRIYPNPTQGRFAVEIGNVPDDVQGQIHVSDERGRLLERKDIRRERKIDFDLSRETAGVYILNIQLGEAVSTRKIIKH